MVGEREEEAVERKNFALALETVVHDGDASVRNPVRRREIHRFGAVEAKAEASVVGLGKGDDELAGLLPRLVNWHVVAQKRRRGDLSRDVMLCRRKNNQRRDRRDKGRARRYNARAARMHAADKSTDPSRGTL